MKNPFYYHVHRIARHIVTFFFPIKVSGIENVPTDRPVVFCANHTSGFDPVLICCAFKSDYPVRLMAKKQLLHPRSWLAHPQYGRISRRSWTQRHQRREELHRRAAGWF